MQGDLGCGKSVSPSVYQRCNCNKRKETFAHILKLYKSSMHLVWRHEEWLVWDVHLYLKFRAKLIHPFKNADFQSIFSRISFQPGPKLTVDTNIV